MPKFQVIFSRVRWDSAVKEIEADDDVEAEKKALELLRSAEDDLEWELSDSEVRIAISI